MSIDLSHFHEFFFEESGEGLDTMEASLLELDPQNVDNETINTIFRAAHSIKGGSSTFGFSPIADLTHILETLLDEVRSKKREINSSDVSLFLQSVDCMREMLSLIKNGKSAQTICARELTEQFSRLLSNQQSQQTSDQANHGLFYDERANVQAHDGVGGSVEELEPNLNVSQRWEIQFIPSLHLLQTGNDIVRIFCELDALCEFECEAVADNLPALNAMDSECCYLAWNITLINNNSLVAIDLAAIEEVFEWVVGDCILNIERIDETIACSPECPSDWTIYFKPDATILSTANDPLHFLNRLSELGDISIQTDVSSLPRLTNLDAEKCFLAWKIEIQSFTLTREMILSVFEWVIDDSTIVIESKNKPVGSPDYTFEIIREKKKIDAVLLKHKEADDSANTSFLQASVVPDSVSQDNVSQDNVSQDRVSQDRVSQDRVSQDRVSQDSIRPAVLGQSISPVISTGQSVKSQKMNAQAVKKVTTEASSIRVGIDKVDNLINMVGELVITQSMLGQLGDNFELEQVPKLIEGLKQLEQNTRELQESVMKIRLLPISFAFSRLPRMVRDLGQTLNKSVVLEVHGEQTELDKTVMEKIGDPLVHLVRNAVDHGIESPEQRERVGKPKQGKILLNAYHKSGHVVIELIDDGKGLNRQKIIEKAIEKNMITARESDLLSNEHVFNLIFHAGFSTAQTVSDVSGRGVGMDVVKRNIQALNGCIDITSVPNQGTTIKIRLPLTLSILEGQLVRVGENIYVFPLVSIVESMQCKKEDVNRVVGGCRVFRLRGEYIPIVALQSAFDVNSDSTSSDDALLVVVENEGMKIGVMVDELLSQQQVVIKSLERNYRRVIGVSGATILGDGTVALILDIAGIVQLSGEDKVNSIQYLNQMSRNANGSVIPNLAH